MTVAIPAMAQVGEEDKAIQICVMLYALENLQRNITFMLDSANVTGTARSTIENILLILCTFMFAAMAGFDYGRLQSVNSFNSYSDNRITCVNISIMDDNALEGNQTLTLALTTFDPSLIVGRNTTVITIVDNDG